MTGYKVVNLKLMLDAIGEDETKKILSSFSCPQNQDVEDFLRRKAIGFSLQGWAQTHLVFTSHEDDLVLVGYFSLANKQIIISDGRKHQRISKTLKKRLRGFSACGSKANSYHISAPLIAQLGKNFSEGYNKLIRGDELLKIACDKICEVQLALGGKFAYLECEDKPKLIQFYERNGFVRFDERELDRDETMSLHGDYLVQMLRRF